VCCLLVPRSGFGSQSRPEESQKRSCDNSSVRIDGRANQNRKTREMGRDRKPRERRSFRRVEVANWRRLLCEAEIGSRGQNRVTISTIEGIKNRWLRPPPDTGVALFQHFRTDRGLWCQGTASTKSCLGDEEADESSRLGPINEI
jgi:hypothetical protein